MHHCILDIHHKVLLTYINHFVLLLNYITSVSISCPRPFFPHLFYFSTQLKLRLGRDMLSKNPIYSVNPVMLYNPNFYSPNSYAITETQL